MAQTLSEVDQILKLKDGRNLGYCIYGPKAGFPIVYFYPGPGCRFLIHPDFEQITTELQVKIIGFDRPGVGLSSPKSGWSLFAVIDDLKELMDYLRIDKFGVLGHSAGTPYALAAAYKLPERVSKAATIGLIVSPTFLADYDPKKLEGLDIQQGLRKENKMVFNLGMKHRLLLRTMFTLSTSTIKNAEKGVRGIEETPGEEEFAKDKRFHELFIRVTNEFFAHGISPFLRELFIVHEPWGFKLSDIKPHVDLWIGENDHFTSPNMTTYASRYIKDCTIHKEQGLGHFSLYALKLQQILYEFKV